MARYACQEQAPQYKQQHRRRRDAAAQTEVERTPPQCRRQSALAFYRSACNAQMPVKSAMSSMWRKSFTLLRRVDASNVNSFATQELEFSLGAIQANGAFGHQYLGDAVDFVACGARHHRDVVCVQSHVSFLHTESRQRLQG